VSAARYVGRAPDVAARKIGGELMIMSGRDSTLYSLNETAALLWDAADGATTLEHIVRERICAEFDVEPAEALADAEEVARDLASHGILVLSDSPIPPAP
jgi:hypothetical protein